jgi:hypothetical protein
MLATALAVMVMCECTLISGGEWDADSVIAEFGFNDYDVVFILLHLWLSVIHEIIPPYMIELTLSPGHVFRSIDQGCNTNRD